MRGLIVVLVLFALTGASGVAARIGDTNPTPVLGQARLLVSAPVGNGFLAHVWRAPSSTGGECSFVTSDRDRTPARPRLMGSGSCSSQAGAASTLLEFGLEISTRLGSRSSATWVPPIVSGSVDPALHTTRVRVEWQGGARDLVLQGSRFVGGGSYLYSPPFKRLPYTIVAYRADRAVWQMKLQSPGLYPQLKGWGEFTPAYQRWRKNH